MGFLFTSMEFAFIDHNSPFLEKVIELGRKNSQTLGLMPRDAYIQQAKKKCIVIAVEGGELLGYCLFRVVETKHRIGITQVCVDPTRRQQGISKKLLNQVQSKYKALVQGMLVSCREDYIEACALWKSFGFVSRQRKRSRSIQEKYLLKYWYSFDQKDLFSSEKESNDLRVVLDLNILIKLRDQDTNSQETLQLLSDWLTDEVDYCYAKETLNEIHRDKDFQRTASTIQFLSSFQELKCDPTESQKFLELLKEIHPGETENHISDRKQLAECKASGIPYFITVDNEMLSNRDEIYEKLGVSILRPAEFILEIDELKNRNLYEPIRLQSSEYEVKRIDSGELLNVFDSFLRKEQGESKNEFQARVLSVTSNPKSCTLKIVFSKQEGQIAFYTARHEENILLVEFVRLKNSTIRNTLFNQILVEIIREALRFNKQIVKVTEIGFSEQQNQILKNIGFIEQGNNWIKVVVNGIGSVGQLRGTHPIVNSHTLLDELLTHIEKEFDIETKEKLKLDLERKLWPLKLSDLQIPCFIVPIKPIWASQLFDYLSANSSLFGAPAELSWSRENVYYRSFNPNVESSPGRILWYASQEKGFSRQKAIVGCSYLNNVVTGEAKQLYSTFKRFGIYTWREIFKLAKGDIRTIIKVLQFSDTEVFLNPVSFIDVNNILLQENFKRQSFVSPVKVNHSVFNSIYKLGKGIS